MSAPHTAVVTVEGTCLQDTPVREILESLLQVDPSTLKKKKVHMESAA